MEATRVTVDEVKERMDRGEAFTFVDTRTAWAGSRRKTAGAIRIPADEVAEHLNQIPRDRTVITYCVTARDIERQCGAGIDGKRLEECSSTLRRL